MFGIPLPPVLGSGDQTQVLTLVKQLLYTKLSFQDLYLKFLTGSRDSLEIVKLKVYAQIRTNSVWIKTDLRTFKY